MSPKRTHPAPPHAAPETADIPALPVWKAFVVQFSRETQTETGVFSGRVEHLSSGRRARFASIQALLATLTSMLADLGEEGSGGY
jgi:hypothetical protein